MRKRPAGGAKRQESAKKILNRGNEPKDLLKTHDLAFFGAKNEPKTNPILSANKRKSRRKTGCKRKFSGDSGWGLGATDWRLEERRWRGIRDQLSPAASRAGVRCSPTSTHGGYDA
jgi:hypothetical protein